MRWGCPVPGLSGARGAAAFDVRICTLCSTESNKIAYRTVCLVVPRWLTERCNIVVRSSFDYGTEVETGTGAEIYPLPSLADGNRYFTDWKDFPGMY